MNTYDYGPKRGFVLVTALILLLLLSGLAMIALPLGVAQTRVAANTGNAQISFETAEGVLLRVQGNLLSGKYSNFAANANGLYTFNPNLVPIWTTINWSGSGVLNSGYTNNSNNPSYFLIEELPSVSLPGQSVATQQYGGGAPPVRVFRITAHAVGANGKVPTLLQSVFYQ